MSHTSELDVFLQTLKAMTSSHDDIRIALAGGDISEDDDGADVAADRQFVKSEVEKTFVGVSPAMHWHESKWCNVTVTTDPPLIVIESHNIEVC